MKSLHEIVRYCDTLTQRGSFRDYPGAYNGLQLENCGDITQVAAAVDASEAVLLQAVASGVDFLIVHHGLFWGPNVPITGHRYRKLQVAMAGNLAIYSSHLPLDAHPEIGNNVLLARQLGLEPSIPFGEYEGQPIGWITETTLDRSVLDQRILKVFPKRIMMGHGPESLHRIAIMTGSGGDLLTQAAKSGADTLITGECSQHHFALSQELGINLILCGHYATETSGVQALAQKVAREFSLPWQFIDTQCPL